ncbi:hypothetical protein POV27_09280 [Aureisphaera galaxeae]|uniref:hypothetical protein n=1 Tax=Aureisphaera galaxeae TaxID=1538023 RepID=UPI0023502984|nr:hypothetical protein [Aureisphaera galaxeae]MDC8004242.1 hypothetical protein [Aureisphaera galaxeae]
MAERWNASGRIKAKFGDIAWNYSFVVTYHPDKCRVTFRPKVQLTFPSSFKQAKKDKYVKAWSEAVAKAFNNKWKLVPVDPQRCEQCKDGIDIRVRVKFVTSWTWTDDQEVTVHEGEDKGSNMTNWYLEDGDFGTTGKIGGVVHEVCHMLGLEDEYLNEKHYPGKKESDLPPDHADGIMDDPNKPVLDRHMEIMAFNKAKVNDHLPCPTYKLAKQ